MLAGTALPDWASGRPVLAVGSQTSRPVDDIGALTDANGWICVQAKKKLALSDDPNGDLASALDQLVALHAEGVPDQPPRQDELRPLDANVDRVLILTDHTAPRTIAVAMAQLVDRLRTWPEGAPLDEAATKSDERIALRTLCDHLKRLCAARHRAAADETVVRSLLRPLAVQALDLRPEGSDLCALMPGLGDLLEDPAKVVSLWHELELIGQRLAAERLWIRHVDLVRELENAGLYLTPVARLRRDVQRLRDITTGNLNSPPTSLAIATPDGPVEVSRAVSALLDASQGNVAVTGDPGVGKSVILHRFAASQTADVVYLAHDQLRGTAGDTRVELNLDHDLHEVLTGWTGSRPALLLFDGIDQTRGVEASNWLPGLAQRLRPTRWRIVGSIRSFDLRHGPAWQTMFSGRPVDPDRIDAELSRVAHLVVGGLTAEEISSVRLASPSIDKVFDQAGDRLTGLLANPFNLNLMGGLIGVDMDVSQVGSRLDLLTRFWRLRVVDAPSGRIRQRALQTLVTSMVATRSQQTSDSQLSDPATLAILDDLLRDGVLREAPASRWAPSRRVGFAHPVLFDYAAAIIALGDAELPDSLADRLDADPDLAIILRPSLDYRLAIAWHNDPSRTSYWRLALRLAAKRSGHVLAAAAAATVAAHHLSDAAELNLLEASCIAAGDDASWTVDDARSLTFLLAGGIETTGAIPAALEAFGELLAGLALHAVSSDDISLALLVAQLGRRATGDHPPAAGTRAADSLVQTAIAAVVVGLADANDPRRAILADPGGRALATAAVLDPSATTDTIRLVIAESALRRWGVRAVRPLIDVLPQIAAQDPDLAVDLGASVWLFEDDPSQPTNMLNSQILPLISNRQQDLESARYQVSSKFCALTAVDLVAATRLLIKIVEGRSSSHNDDVQPQSYQRLRIRYADDLRYAGGHQSLPTMADALVERLEELAPACDEAIVLLSDNLTHPGVWNRLLDRAATSESPALANALLPVLAYPSLFASSQTWPHAARLVSRLSPVLPEPERNAIEQAIVAATEPDADDSERLRNSLRERRDMLLSTLAANRTGQDAELPTPPVISEAEALDGWEHDTERAVPSAEATLLQEVNEALAAAGQSNNYDAASRRLLAVWPQLAAEHVAHPADRQLHERLLRAAGYIARLPEVLPDTAIGEQIFLAVETAMPEPIPAGKNAAINGSRLASWLATPETSALETARVLLARPEWQCTHGDRLRAHLHRHLDSSEWVYRFLSTGAIGLIYTEPDELLSHVESRLATEPDDHVAAVLVRMLARYLHARPGDVGEIFARLATLRGSLYLIEPGQGRSGIHDTAAEAVVQCLTVLSAVHDTAFADATIRAWLSDPVGNAAAVIVIAAHLRDILNPADQSLLHAQQKAFELLTLTVEPLLATPVDDAAARNALTVANEIAMQVYYASGAFKRPEDSRSELGAQVGFARLALPLLNDIGKVHHPAVTHHIVETAEHLSSAQPKPALLLAMRTISGDPGYVTDSLGIDAALKLVNRYMADQRELILGDPECTGAIRLLLEGFVRVGWPQAAQMAERMDELFR